MKIKENTPESLAREAKEKENTKVKLRKVWGATLAVIGSAALVSGIMTL
jgi:hypothetical protein